MTETEDARDQTQPDAPSEHEEKTDREEGGPTRPHSPEGEPEGATGTRPTEGFEPHE